MNRLFSASALHVLGVAGLALCAGAAHGAIISDASFFDSKPTTLITFETNGAGSPVTLLQGQSLAMPANEYAALGVTLTGIGSSVYWVNDGNAAFDAAQTVGASPTVSIPSSLNNSFTLTFSTEVRAFGFFVANNRLIDSTGPVFVARDAGGNVIETVTFGNATNGSPFVDGTFTIPNTTADYGFMGLVSSVPIASVTVTKQAAILDDLRFSAVPAPGMGAATILGAGLLGLRRRRSR
jgi:hypothetical protein